MIFSITARYAAGLAFAAIVSPLAAQGSRPVLTIQADKPIAKVSPTLYGLMTEEINYSYDGGLYGELISNRTFTNRTSHWNVVLRGNAQAGMELDKTTGPSAALPVSLRLNIKTATAQEQAGVSNDGFWGIPVRPATRYRCSYYAKTDSASAGAVEIALVANDTGATLAQAAMPSLTTEWHQYSGVLATPASIKSSANTHLELRFSRPGTVWLSLVSLFPPTFHGRPNGNRIDLMQKMTAMHPSFLRLPGGNYLEGDHIADRFQWKQTIGPLVDRPTHLSPWRYRSSDGMGLLEFLEWCEDLRMQPVLAVYAGYSLMQEHVVPGAELKPYVDDALDEIEYVTGDAGTKWGAERVKDGHPAPFPLTYVEVGNEDEFDKSKSYDGRFAQFYDAIRSRYPAVQIIATTPVATRRPDLVDDHFYRSAQQFFDDVHHYDNTDRKGPKIFVGEWAAREGSPTPNMGGALGDAAWMTGMERNSDLVVMASYAPLLVNVNPGGMQWETDLIGYNSMTSYGSPSYYAQVMFSGHHGDEVVASAMSAEVTRFAYSVTRNAATGTLYLKVVNGSSVPRDLQIDTSGWKISGEHGKLISLSGRTVQDTNTITDPKRIVPVETPLSGTGSSFRHVFPPYSIQILEWSGNPH